MKKADLLKVLDLFEDDDFVYISINGAKTYFSIGKIEVTILGKPILLAEEAPDFESIEGMAVECYKEHKKSMSNLQKEALKSFGEVAEAVREEERKERGA